MDEVHNDAKEISPWWMFLEPRRLRTGAKVPGVRELQAYAAHLDVHDRDYARSRLAVTEEWNKMTNAAAIETLRGTWGYVGKLQASARTRMIRACFSSAGSTEFGFLV